MVAIWRPEPYLPQRAYRDSLNLAPGENRLISPTESGGEDARRRSSARRDRIRLRMPFTYDQVQYFWGFYRDELADGVYDFWFPGQGGAGAPISPAGLGGILVSPAGEMVLAPDWWLVRFDRRTDPPVFEQRGRDYDGVLPLTRRL